MADGKAGQNDESPSNGSSILRQGLVRERDKNFVRPSGPVQKKDDIVEDVVRAAAAGFGFISEAVHHHREKKGKASDANTHHPPQPLETQKPDSQRLNEAIWNIDDAEQEATEDQKKAPKASKDPIKLAKAFLQRHPGRTELNSEAQGMLALPVVLPQRRPEQRSRGFVRAYAPVLADAGVDQRAFLDFVDTFNKSLEPNPWVNALNLASLAELPVPMPEPVSMLFGYAVDLAVEAALEASSRVRSRNFLDHINAEFFLPRGLVCLVATWKPDSSDEEVTVGFDGKATAPSTNATDFRKSFKSIIAQQSSTDEELLAFQKRMQDKMRSSQGMVAWSEPAPLVFPTIDELAASEAGYGNGKKKGAMDRADQWIEEYSDKRAQIKWKDDNPDHSIANSLPRAEFRSRYADPNHPATSGDIVALFTGGRWQYQSKKKSAKKDVGDMDSSKVVPAELPATEPQSRGLVELPAESSKPDEPNNDKPSKEESKEEPKQEETVTLGGSTSTDLTATDSGSTASKSELMPAKEPLKTSDADSNGSSQADAKKDATTDEDDQTSSNHEKTEKELKAEQKAEKKKRAKEEEEEKRQAKKIEAQEKKAKEKEAKELKAREKDTKEKEAKEKKAKEKEEKENEKRKRKAREKEEKERKAREKKAAPSAENILKGLFQKDVLYLIIVNSLRRDEVNTIARADGAFEMDNTPA